MKMFHKRFRRNVILAVAAGLASPWGSVLAADNGCYHSNDGIYQIGQSRQMEVTNSIPAGTIVREEEAYGDGNILATCMQGVARFEGDFTVPLINSMVPLTVGGAPSGFGLELFLRDFTTGQNYPFPHSYTRTFPTVGTPVRSNEASVGYRVKRMTGPVVFGHVDARTIAHQWTYQPNGARTDPFRHMTIYELAFVRPACSITPESINQSVHVGDFHVNDFDNPDKATMWREFRLAVQECQEPVGMIASITFGTPSDSHPDAADFFSLPRGPEGVALEIGDYRKRTMKPGVPAQFNAVGTGEDFVFNVRMRNTRQPLVAGEFIRPVTVLVDFR